MRLLNPMVETDEVISCIASEKNLEVAALRAARDMFDFLKEKTELKGEELAMLLSAVGDLQISQIVDPLKTARFTVKKEFLR